MAGSKPPFTLRLARTEDAASLRELIAHSVRVVESPDYSRRQIEGSLEGTQGDTRLIVDGTYYVAEAIKGSGEPARRLRRVKPAENTLWQRQPGRPPG